MKDTEGKGWCLDSGCTSHMCSDENLFLNTPKGIKNQKLLLASDAYADVNAKGTARVVTADGKSNRSIKLYNTLFIKNLRTNLLSVAKITDRDNTVIFDKNRAVVRGNDGSTKLIASRVGNLYYVQEGVEESNAVSTEQGTTTMKTWHRRLGHLNASDMLKMLKGGIAGGMRTMGERTLKPCDVCLRGKMTALPFPKQSNRRTKLLELVHSDVWGPARTESFRRSKYFVTFIDDSSRWCEVYFIKSKSDVLRVFKEYKSRVETQVGAKIKCLMTDNGREYCNREFDDFLVENGIRRQLTVPNTPQQNGVAERKNRSLVDMTRCMLIESGLAHKFWAEALSTANYLRNRCPTVAKDGHTPYELWKGTPPDVSNLRVFGATAYVLDKTPGKGKLDPRSKQGVMVGYSEESKGYRIWIKEDRKVVVARDVKFLEEEFQM